MRLALVLGVLLPLALAGCEEAEPLPPQNFAALHYDYLPKLRLNVGNIEVVDHSAPTGPDDIAGSAPVLPSQALAQMAHERLFAAGSAGTANFVIDQASIVREPNGTLDGTLGVHLDIITPEGTRAGYAEARVARQHIPGSEPEDERTNLYNLTRRMIDDLNVELEFQLKRSLGNWMVSGNAAAAPVQAQPLAPPGTEAPAMPPPGAQVAPPPPPAPPPQAEAPPPRHEEPEQEQGYQDPALPPPPPKPQQLSPPPSYLQPPPGTVPVPSAPQANGYPANNGHPPGGGYPTNGGYQPGNGY